MIPFYRGELAREIGIDGAPIDFLVHWLDVRDHVQENYEARADTANSRPSESLCRRS